jgi:hypothetical protein
MVWRFKDGNGEWDIKVIDNFLKSNIMKYFSVGDTIKLVGDTIK